ncbi:hypothetical protein [Phenylobacterium sp.]|uniref:hypothetical protein n=1 Tax=Phenylobacterium sp. TaxID=1871053 RepID=UPI0025F24F96|nr:hypothetical protein [Phenylobacterium sp.]
MADDGGWPKPASAEPVAPDDERTRLAMGELRTVLGELERRLATAPAQRPETVTAVAHSLAALGRQMARNEAAAQARARELAAAVGSMTQYLEIQMSSQVAREDQLNARLDRLLIELEHVRVAQATRRTEPGPVRLVLAAASVAALLSLVGAGVALVTQGDAPGFGASPIVSAEANAPNS